MEEEIKQAVNEIFDGLDINDSLEELEMLISHIEDLIQADYMWQDAAEDEISRRVLVAAVGVVAIKFASLPDELADFINGEEEDVN